MTLSIETCIRRTPCADTTAFPEGVLLIQVSMYLESNVDGTRGGGGGILLGILGRGVPPGSPNPDFISGQNMSFSTTCFQTRPLLKTHTVFRPGPSCSKSG